MGFLVWELESGGRARFFLNFWFNLGALNPGSYGDPSSEAINPGSYRPSSDFINSGSYRPSSELFNASAFLEYPV